MKRILLIFALLCVVSATLTAAVGQPVLIWPMGKLTINTPTYSWNAVAGASWYQLFVSDSTRWGRIVTWYSASQVRCASGFGQCYVTPSTIIDRGPAQWWVIAWSDSGGEGPWSDAMYFSVDPPPDKYLGTLTDPAGNMFLIQRLSNSLRVVSVGYASPNNIDIQDLQYAPLSAAGRLGIYLVASSSSPENVQQMDFVAITNQGITITGSIGSLAIGRVTVNFVPTSISIGGFMNMELISVANKDHVAVYSFDGSTLKTVTVY